MKYFLFCILLSIFSSCLTRSVDSEVFYNPPLLTNGLNNRPVIYWKSRPNQGYQIPEDASLEEENEEPIRIALRSSPTNPQGQRSDYSDLWSYNRKRNDELSRLAMRMLKRSHPSNGQNE